MDKQQILEKIRKTKIIPVLRGGSIEEIIAITKAILKGGLDIIEITMTIPDALSVIETVNRKYGKEILIGAGTILDSETARMAILSGAEFIVSPVANSSIVTMTHRYSKLCILGALTPTEVLAAWESGSDIVKIFPCDAVGGPEYIKSIKAPLPQIELIPTRGISDKNIPDYLKAGAIAVGVGPSLLRPELIKQGRWQELTKLTRHYISIVQSVYLEDYENVN